MYGAENGDAARLVFVHDTSEAIATLDESGPTPGPPPTVDMLVRRVQGQRSMRPVDVIVVHEDGDDSLKMPLV